MSQPVRLSDVLVLDARLTDEIAERSIAGQIEYWANLGRAIESLPKADQAMTHCKKAAARPLSESLTSVNSPKDRSWLEKHLDFYTVCLNFLRRFWRQAKA